MSLRRRIALAAAAAVGAAAIVVALASYFAAGHELRGEVDGALRREAAVIERHPVFVVHERRVPSLPPRQGPPASYVQLVTPTGRPRALRTPVALPVDARTRSIAARGDGDALASARVAGAHLRLLTVGLPGGGAVELGRSLAPVDQVLGHLQIVLVVVAAAGIALAAGLGWFAARRLMSPLGRVTAAARHIGETDDLAERIDVDGHDEVAELARRFNAMLDTLATSREALDRSMRDQRQLVADASHELRTPITSLRTNIEVLLDGHPLVGPDRDRLLGDVLAQTEELGALVGDLIELARGEQPNADRDEVRLDRLVEEGIARARRNTPDVEFDTALDPVVVDAIPDRLARAVNNLLDNAAKHTRPGTAVHVTVDDRGVTVRDHGPGIPDGDLAHVFDRFYRGANARAHAGSGLGLAIVRQVAETHAGRATAANAPDGGAVFTLALPTHSAADGPTSSSPLHRATAS